MLITQCPDCHSLFRVTQGQLKLAHGKVRCGACMMVFDALDHALDDEDQSPAPSQQPTSAVTSPENSPVAPQATGETQSSIDNLTQEEPLLFEPKQQQSTGSATETTQQTITTQTSEPLRAHSTTPLSEPPQTADRVPELNIRVEPLILRTEHAEETSPVQILFWLVATLITLGLLAGQYLWFERATLASQQSLRAIYQTACEYISCDLGRLEGIQELRTQEVHVRPHQLYADLISLSTRIENRAAFAQPYPALEVSFTNLKSRLVSRRTFQPQDYLPVTQQGHLLPAGVDLEVNLPLTDPGVQAVSYKVELRQAAR